MHPVQKKIYAAMSPQQKWDQAVQMRKMAWTIKAAGLRTQHPDWDEARVQDETRRIFLHART